jgi:hypothetical protein
MTEATQGEVVSLDNEKRQKRLEELEHAIVGRLCELAVAVAEIHRDSLYEVAGYESFVAYCDDRLQRKRSMAYQLLAAGQVFPLLDSAIAENIRSESVFRPIAKMRPESQAKVLTLAVNVAKKQGLRLTAGIVEDVAEKNFNWLPESKRKQQRKEQAPEDSSLERFKDIELGIASILDCGLSGGDAVAEFGSISTWPRGLELWTFIKDAMEASEA